MIQTQTGLGSKLRSMRGVVIRCTCKPEEARAIHGTDANGAMNPCPNGRLEYLGELSRQEATCEKYGCATWEEFRDGHPIAYRFYQARVLFEDAREEARAMMR